MSGDIYKFIRDLQRKTRQLKRDMYSCIWSNPDKNFLQKVGITIEYWIDLRLVDLKMGWKRIKLEWKNLQDH